ncbi:DUF7676 family protein [Streptomyces sp. BBFR102]
MDLLTRVFTDHWRSINFGPIIEGAAWEVGAPRSRPTSASTTATPP